jgi:ATP-binding cassette subfamily B protein
VLDPDLRQALRYVAPYWRRLSLVLALSLLGTLLLLLVPYLSKALVDRALLGRDATLLAGIVLAFTALTLTSFALNVVAGLRYTRVSAEILFDMRLALFRHLQRLSPRFYASMPIGQIASRINSDMGEIQRIAAELAMAWVGNVLYLAGTVVILWLLDPLLFLVTAALLPPALWALVRYRRRLEGAVAELRNESANVGSFLIETLLGMKLVVALNAQEREVARFRERNDRFIHSLMTTRRLSILAGGVPGLVIAAGGSVVFLVGGWRVIEGATTLGTLVAFVAYQMRLFGPIQGLMGLYTSIATARVSLRRVNEILDVPVDVREPDQAAPALTPRGDVRFEHVTFSHDRGTPVLNDLSLAVRAGERVAIVGRSGGGKSTIADLLVRHADPDRGRLLLDEHDLRSLRLDDLRRHVVVVDHDPFVFNASIAENIRYARPAAPAADVLAAARAAGLSDLIDGTPLGLETLVGERGRALSAGERQRLAIARAFLADPAVLVLDEATAALDPATESQVVSGYEAVMRGRTTIVITHRLEMARRADRVVVLRDGRIEEEGTADALAERGGTFADLFPALQTTG